MSDLGWTANCLERVLHFIRIEHERTPGKLRVPPAYWPASGELIVENLSARYSEGTISFPETKVEKRPDII